METICWILIGTAVLGAVATTLICCMGESGKKKKMSFKFGLGKSKLKELKKDIACLEDEINTILNGYYTLKADFDDLAHENELLKKEIKHLNKKIKRLGVAELEEGLSEIDSRVLELELYKDELDEKIQDYERIDMGFFNNK